MGDSPATPKLTPYGEGRFAAHLPFGRTGYLFTVGGDYPADVPAFCHLPELELAVYRTRRSGAEMWEVRDTNMLRQVWAESRRCRDAVGMALLEIARKRRERAADIRERRVSVRGLEPEPPYRVATAADVDLVLSPVGVGCLARIEPGGVSEAAMYRCAELATGREFTVAADKAAVVRGSAGVLHERCSCPETGVAGFHETREDAIAYLIDAYTTWWPCTDVTA
ncbi:hypothetical protein [Streptomyces sp. BH104]|uniref:hypothetical protein n=1 Tax=Streptomyces sp. BH104 TaxID=3410407 RepID=UPI003BB525FD